MKENAIAITAGMKLKPEPKGRLPDRKEDMVFSCCRGGLVSAPFLLLDRIRFVIAECEIASPDCIGIAMTFG